MNRNREIIERNREQNAPRPQEQPSDAAKVFRGLAEDTLLLVIVGAAICFVVFLPFIAIPLIVAVIGYGIIKLVTRRS